VTRQRRNESREDTRGRLFCTFPHVDGRLGIVNTPQFAEMPVRSTKMSLVSTSPLFKCTMGKHILVLHLLRTWGSFGFSEVFEGSRLVSRAARLSREMGNTAFKLHQRRALYSLGLPVYATVSWSTTRGVPYG
jgi:hypothetical protein